MDIVELDNRSSFLLENFKFVVGDYATYNNYYKIKISNENGAISIGLQAAMTGIAPQAMLCNKFILIGAEDKFYIYDLDGNLIKKYSVFSSFYEFKIIDDFCLVIGELNVFLLNGSFEKIWEQSFDEIIDITKVENGEIFLKNINDETIRLDFLTGEISKPTLK